MNTRILITGANGFLGSSIVKLAVKKKFKVSVLVRENSDLKNLKEIKSKLEFYYGDLRNFNLLELAIADNDIVFHVAADYRLWSRNPKELYDSNVRGTENVCKLVSKYNKTLIYTSSVATLGINDENESNENTPVTFKDMLGDYKKSKYLAENIVLRFYRKKKIKCIIVNPSTPIGPGDIKPTPTGKIIYDVLNGRMPAYVDTGLNLVHVDDVAEGHFLALKYGSFGDKYILGGENLHFKEFLDLITEYGNKPKISLELNPKFLIPFAYLNELFHRFFINATPSLTVDGLNMSKKKMFFSSSKAKKKLRYRPRTVKNAIKESVEWFSKYKSWS